MLGPSMNLYTATITLILVMDPLGNVPLFLATLKSVSPARRKYITLRETFIALIILLLFLFFGQYMLQSMQISQPALSIAGGIILFLIAIKMIFPHEEEGDRTKQIGEPFIVPLAIPFVAGPSSLTFVMLLASSAPDHIMLWMFALILAWLACAIILLFSDILRKILGERCLLAIEKLMGMILTTMAAQMFLTGVQEFFHLT